MTKSPLEVIQEGEREFDRRFIQDMRWINKKDFPQPILHHNKSQTLALLQALHDELEGKKMVVEMALGNPKSITALRGYNDSIQDQKDNLQALMDRAYENL